MLQIFIAITLLGLLLYAVFRPNPATLRRHWRKLLLWGGLGLMVVLVLTGRMHWLFAAAAGFYALIRRLLPLLPLLLPTLRRLWATEHQRDAGATATNNSRADSTASMTLAEARAILGVDEQADRAAIIAAHRRLMQKIHPDRGGSSYLAGRVNEAKRRLLSQS
ncbi:MAG: hypothetical protein WED00_10510 [Aquisalimonadaceae bacterium]